MSPDRQDKIFIVSQGGIKDRFDAEYFILNDKNNLNGYIPLGDIVTIKGGKRIPKGNTYSEMFYGYKYLRVDDINEEGEFEFNELKNIDENTYNSIKNYYIEKDNLCISIAGTIGKIALIDEDYNNKLILTENCAKLIVNDKNIVLPRYLRHILKLAVIRKQLNLSYGQATIAKLSLERLKNIKIPLPPLEIQQEIVEKMDSALAEKKNLENKSDEILNSIDDYVLSELGIELEKQEEKIYFSVDLKDIIENNRFDPSYFINSFKIKKSDYELKNIYDIAEIKKGQSITQDKIIEGEYPVIAGGQTSPYNHNQKNYDGNVITISASGAYSGYVRYHEKPIFASDCSVVFSKNENFISTFFIYSRLKINQKEIYKMQKGAGQPHVYPDDIGNFIIPLPPREIQDKITNEVKSRIKKANELKKQANEIYEQAKNEVEKMILE